MHENFNLTILMMVWFFAARLHRLLTSISALDGTLDNKGYQCFLYLITRSADDEECQRKLNPIVIFKSRRL